MLVQGFKLMGETQFKVLEVGFHFGPQLLEVGFRCDIHEELAAEEGEMISLLVLESVTLGIRVPRCPGVGTVPETLSGYGCRANSQSE